MASVVSQSLYDNLDFTVVGKPIEKGLDKFLKDSALNYEKSNAYQDTTVKPPTLEAGYSSFILGSLL